MKEQGLDVEFYLWVGLFAPKGTPTPSSSPFVEAAKAAVANEKFVASIGNLGDTIRYMDQPDFVKFWDDDAKRVEAAVQSIGKVEG